MDSFTTRVILLKLMLTAVCPNDFTCNVSNVFKPYDTDTQICCSGLHQKRQNGTVWQCCAGKLYDSSTQTCCGAEIHELTASRLCCNGTMHDKKDTNTQKELVCCGEAVYYQGIGICCNGSFTKRIGNVRMECRNGKGVPKPERTLNLPEGKCKQLRELGTQEGLRAKPYQNETMVDEYLPQGSAVKPGTLVLDGVEQCGQVVYPRESSTTRYYCCDSVFYKTPHLDPNADFAWECCGTILYNTSSRACCGGKLIDTSLQPVDCCNDAVEYIKSFQLCCGGLVLNKNEYLCYKHTSSSPGTPVPKEAVDHNATCYDYKTRKFKTYNDKQLICHEGTLMPHKTYIDMMRNEILEDELKNTGGILPNPQITTRHSSPTCPFTECDMGIYNRTSECRKRTRLDYLLHTMSKHNGHLVLYGIVTFPPEYTGTLLTINTINECQNNCFETDILYSIYTNRFTKRLPSTSRLSKRDIVVKKYKKSFSCTIDPWAKQQKG